MNILVFTLKLLIAVTLCCNLAGCGLIPTPNIAPTPEISTDPYHDMNEGILITKIRTNIEKSEVHIHGKRGGWPWADLTDVNGPEDLRVIRIKSGEATFTRVYMGNSYVISPTKSFTIEPKTITYVGDLVVEWFYQEGSVAARIVLIDREDETVGEARKKYPWIFNVYKYKKDVPGER